MKNCTAFDVCANEGLSCSWRALQESLEGNENREYISLCVCKKILRNLFLFI